MTSASKPLHAAAPFFVVRSPLLPVDVFDELLALADRGRAETRAALESALIRYLRAWVRVPEVREALRVASPSISAAVSSWLEAEAPPPDVTRVVLRYVLRMASRPTPFGLFSGCSVGRIGSRSHIEFAERARYRRFTRLDVQNLVQLAQVLGRRAEIAASVWYFPNSSLYACGGQFRYAELRTATPAGAPEYALVGSARSAPLDTLVECAARGATLAELSAKLEERHGASADAAREFLETLIENQFLVSELQPLVTGEEPLGALAATLHRRAPEHPATRIVAELRALLERLDGAGVCGDPAAHEALQRSWDALTGEAPAAATLVTVDLFKPVVEAQLDRRVVNTVRDAVYALHRIVPYEEPKALRRFREAFVERWETAEVPLSLALDADLGIGFGTSTMDPAPLLEGIDLPSSADGGERTFAERDSWLLHRIVEAERTGALEWALDASDLDALALAEAPPDLPSAFEVNFSLGARSAAALEEGDFSVVLHSLIGPSGGRYLARFCQGDPDLERGLAGLLQAEEAAQPDVVFAELVHLPAGRAGNVVLRPVLRALEIPYLGRAGAPSDRQIPLSDLLISVREERIVLRSARLDREVRIRSTTAHDFNLSEVAVYRFLCALQFQGCRSGLRWSWGAVADAPFLPRVRLGRAILSAASWRLSKAEIRGIEAVAGRAAALRELRRRRRLPRVVCLTDGDRVLPIDLDNEIAVEALLDLLKGRDSVSLAEMIPTPSDTRASGPEGRFTTEIVLPFVPASPAPGSSAPVAASSPARRTFAPGSEWLFVKVYLGTMSADGVLRDAIAPVARRALRDGHADAWFFIRYGDPNWHIRCRLHGDPRTLSGEVLVQLHRALSPLLGDGVVSRVSIDTYVREVERYGGAEAIEVAESIFHVDSECVVDLLDQLEAAEDPGRLRWQLALLGTHRLLLDFGLDTTAARRVAGEMRDSMAKRWAFGGAFERQVGATFRRERAGIESLVDHRGACAGCWIGGEALDLRSEHLAMVVERLRHLERSGALRQPTHQLVKSYGHMFLNRVLCSQHAEQEFVIWDFLYRLYTSQAVRERRSPA
jgi:thiopeptide-type bacteriocin biosynthesis protein